MSFEFKAYPSTPRLFNSAMDVTEKLDGTNVAIQIQDWNTHWACAAQSRKRLITREDDNFGFAQWVYENMEALVATLGVGIHYGEWWGHGIQRGYGLQKGDRRFSLFNVKRWLDKDLSAVPGLDVVPLLYQGGFSEAMVRETADSLHRGGSVAAPGFMRPEGVCVYHHKSNKVFKYTPYEKNDGHKGES